MNAAVAILGHDHDGRAGLWQERATPAWPPARRVPRVGLRPRQTLRRRQGEQQPGPPQGDAHGPRGFLPRDGAHAPAADSP
jgi:hypothetical protein